LQARRKKVMLGFWPMRRSAAPDPEQLTDLWLTDVSEKIMRKHKEIDRKTASI
jgi:hypothetical protein